MRKRGKTAPYTPRLFRPPDDIETVRRQQRELRRIRQRARRINMTEAQMDKRRERDRAYYLRKKAEKIEQVKEEEEEEEMDVDVEVDHSEEPLKTKMLDPKKSRLTYVKHLARNLDFNMVRGGKRITNIRREARNMHSAVLDSSEENRRPIQKFGNSLDNNGAVLYSSEENRRPIQKFENSLDNNGSLSLLQECTEVEFSRMKRCASAARIGSSKGFLKINIHKRDVNNSRGLYGIDTKRFEDSEGSSTDSEELLACEGCICFFLMCLSPSNPIFPVQDNEQGNIVLVIVSGRLCLLLLGVDDNSSIVDSAKLNDTLDSLSTLISLPWCQVVLMSYGAYGAKATNPDDGYLLPYHYRDLCPFAEEIVRRNVKIAVRKDPRMAASLLRLHFHDCFVMGCDASVLLDNSVGIVSEKEAVPNLNSLRGYEVIDRIKALLEEACPKTVSCADLLAIAARDAVVLRGGPSWEVGLGRLDSLTASFSGANQFIPAPNSSLETLISNFAVQGLGIGDLVALSGSHTIGKSRCTSFKQRIYNPDIEYEVDRYKRNTIFRRVLRSICPEYGRDDAVVPLDLRTPARFDNQYFRNLIEGNGLLNSDNVLISQDIEGEIRKQVWAYASDEKLFFKSFAASMVKMGNINVLTGAEGQIRRNCRCVNTW
ncbi:hypothetical protein IFM89_027658 [Coptis chinensis]|uniref:Plant heme peroxidase family profile domain-containing protein n=1 Tax=Coptis chinensis TaxID=261450 RepID=A0A835IYR1_9MAGN|nr:hypothetical protein IFM89_027658 [Coptis chinensis]